MFQDRVDAGKQLANKLSKFANEKPVVIGLPRGGVPVALQVAKALQAPLDIIVVRKLGVPHNPELGFGAISEEDVVVYNRNVLEIADIDASAMNEAVRREKIELARRLTKIRAQHREIPLKDRTVIIVDDGIATGIDARAACRVARARGAGKVVLAVPVAPTDWKTTLERDADLFVAVAEVPDFRAVAEYYAEFTQTTDEEVLTALNQPCLTP